MNTTHGKLQMEHPDFEILMEIIRPRIKLFLDRLSGHQWIRLVTGFNDDQTVDLITEMCEDVMDVCFKHNLKNRSQLSKTESPGQPVKQCFGYNVFRAIADVVGASGCDESDLTSDLNKIMNEALTERINSHLSRSRSSDEVSQPAASFAGRLMVRHVLDLLKTLVVRSCSDKPTEEILDMNSAISDAVSEATTVESTTEEAPHKWDKSSCRILVGGFVHHCMKDASFKLSRIESVSVTASIQEILWTEISGSVRVHGKVMKRTIKAAHMDLCKAFGGSGTLRLSLLAENESVSKLIVETLKRHLVSPQKGNCVKGFFKVLRKNVVKQFMTYFSKK